MFKLTLLFVLRRRIKSIFFKLNLKSFEFQSVSTMNHYYVFWWVFFNSCIIENIKIFVTFNKIFIINNSFLKSFAQAARSRKFFNINFFHSLIFCLKLFNQKLYKFFRLLIKIVRNVINDFSRDNNLNVDQFKYGS